METIAQEPWAFGEPWESLVRDMLLLRMRLLPYLYGLFEEASRTGAERTNDWPEAERVALVLVL